MTLCCALLVSTSCVVGMDNKMGSSSSSTGSSKTNEIKEEEIPDIDFKDPVENSDNKRKSPFDDRSKSLFKVRIIETESVRGYTSRGKVYTNKDINVVFDGGCFAVIKLNSEPSLMLIYDITAEQTVDTKIDGKKIIDDFDKKLEELQKHAAVFKKYAKENNIFSEPKSDVIYFENDKKEIKPKSFYTEVEKGDETNPDILNLLKLYEKKNIKFHNDNNQLKIYENDKKFEINTNESAKFYRECLYAQKELNQEKQLPDWLKIPTDEIIEATKKYNFSFKQVNPWDIEDTKKVIEKITGFDERSAGRVLEGIINNGGEPFIGCNKKNTENTGKEVLVVTYKDKNKHEILSGRNFLSFENKSTKRGFCPEKDERLFLLAANMQFDNWGNKGKNTQGINFITK